MGYIVEHVAIDEQNGAIVHAVQVCVRRWQPGGERRGAGGKARDSSQGRRARSKARSSSCV
jgi:hypothetical protein